MHNPVTYTAPKPNAVVFFLCPYATSHKKLMWAIKKLTRVGFLVVVYEYPREIFTSGDPNQLFDCIAETEQSMKKIIKEQSNQGLHEFGFVGSSLGAFVGYNCMARVPELSWGILNTGGNVAEAVLNFDEERNAFYANGYNREQMEATWQPLQYPDLGDLTGKRIVLLASKADKTVSYASALDCLEHIKAADADVELITFQRLGHRATVIHNLLRIEKLVAKLRMKT